MHIKELAYNDNYNYYHFHYYDHPATYCLLNNISKYSTTNYSVSLDRPLGDFAGANDNEPGTWTRRQQLLTTHNVDK